MLKYNFFFSLALQPPWVLASAFQFRDHFTNGRTPWTSDQLVARPLPKHRTTQTQNKHIHTPNIHALCAIRTYDSSFRAKTVHALDRSATVTGLKYFSVHFTEQLTDFGLSCIYEKGSTRIPTSRLQTNRFSQYLPDLEMEILPQHCSLVCSETLLHYCITQTKNNFTVAFWTMFHIVSSFTSSASALF
jgi:hypothetical protein